MEEAISDALSIPPKYVNFILGFQNYLWTVTVSCSITDLRAPRICFPLHDQIFTQYTKKDTGFPSDGWRMADGPPASLRPAVALAVWFGLACTEQ